MKRILILFIIVSLAPGCLILPLPADHRGATDKAQSQIKIGSTTRQEVISILGRPTVTTDRYILYHKKEYSGGVFFASQEGSITRWKVFMDLYFEFDNFGIVTDFRVDKYDKDFNTVE